jgi:lipopolysaccharide export system protein LptA
MNITLLVRSPAGIALLLAATGATPSVGQEPGLALRGHNANAPVDWSAERVEVQDRADRVFLSGNVIVSQGELRLRAPRIRVAYSQNGGIQVDRIDASGGVRMDSPSESARSEFAVYDLDRKLITMVGGVVLTNPDATIRGGRLVIDLNSGRAVMDGGASGLPSSGDPASPPTGRVSGRFTVPQRASNPAN